MEAPRMIASVLDILKSCYWAELDLVELGDIL